MKHLVLKTQHEKLTEKVKGMETRKRRTKQIKIRSLNQNIDTTEESKNISNVDNLDATDQIPFSNEKKVLPSVENQDNNEEEDEANELDEIGTDSRLMGPLNAENLAAFQKVMESRGVVYIGRVPPLMTPVKMRQALKAYGEVTKLFLAKEPNFRALKRKQAGGNGRIRYVEGWVEFADKKVAKAIAKMLNNNPMGGKKASVFHDDLWNIKYLSGFKWSQLKEQIAYEKAVKEAKLRTEIQQSRKESEFILQKAKQAKAIEFREKAERAGGTVSLKRKPDDQNIQGAEVDRFPSKRSFKQSMHYFLIIH